MSSNMHGYSFIAMDEMIDSVFTASLCSSDSCLRQNLYRASSAFIFVFKEWFVIFFPFYIIILLARTLKGKENINSLKSRFAIYNQKRKKEKLIWVHAASVGESIIAINLVDQLRTYSSETLTNKKYS